MRTRGFALAAVAALVAGCANGASTVAAAPAAAPCPSAAVVATDVVAARVPPAPVVYRIDTAKPVVFLTIDDGWTRDPRFPRLLSRTDVPVSLFLVAAAAREDYDYFRSLQARGAVIEDHTLDHPDCGTLTYAEQVQQICATADQYAQEFGHRPALFRPPYGTYDTATQRAATTCGMLALVEWDVTVNSGRLAYAVGDHLRPGDIILMHFTANLRADFKAAVAAAEDQGLRIRRLERRF